MAFAVAVFLGCFLVFCPEFGIHDPTNANVHKGGKQKDSRPPSGGTE